MVKAYNSIDRQLIIKYRDIVEFDLILRPHITQIYGDSATGKTLLVDCIKMEQNNYKNNTSIAKYDTSNIKVFDSNMTIYDLKSINNGIIIIDRADLFLDKSVIEYISSDTKNQYLVMARAGLNFGISPNYYGQFVKDNNKVTIQYDYSIKGWF